MKILAFFFLSLSSAAFGAECSMGYGQIPIYEKEILAILDSPNKSQVKNLDKISRPLFCLTKMAQEGSPKTRLTVSNSFYALIGGQSLPGETEAEKKRFERSALMLKSLGSKYPKEADRLNQILSGFLKGEWESYKLFCEKGDISYCLVFLPQENDVDAQDDLVAAASMLKWQIAHSKVDLKQRVELETRMKSLYKKRTQFPILKRWFVEKIYFEMMPQELPLGMV